DSPDEPILIDFGLAWADDKERLTRTGTTLGTPAYMAPEQAGATAPVTAHADVYSPGAPPFAAPTGAAPLAADSLPELIAKVLMEPPPPPSAVMQGVPYALDAICAVALAKRPEDRYASAGELRDDLDRFLAGKTPLAVGRAPRPARRTLRRM